MIYSANIRRDTAINKVLCSFMGALLAVCLGTPVQAVDYPVDTAEIATRYLQGSTNDKLTVESTGSIITTNTYAISAITSSTSDAVTNDSIEIINGGTIDASASPDYAISSEVANTTITNNAGGGIFGGIFLSGADYSTVTNNASGIVDNSRTSSATGRLYSKGIYAEYGDNVTTINSGMIGSSATSTMGSSFSYGISIYRGASVAITNSGIIAGKAISIAGESSSSADAHSYGVLVGWSTGAIITNNAGGTISSSATSIASYSRSFGIDALWSNNSIITNHGTVSSSITARDSSDNYGILASGDNINITNNGAISNSATSVNGNLSNHGVFALWSNGTTIINNGTISSNVTSTNGGSTSHGIRTYGDDGITINNGTVSNSMTSASGGLSGYGMGISGGNATITNSGTVSSNAASASGYSSSYGVYADGDNATITNSGTISSSATSTKGDSYSYGVFVYGDDATINLTGGKVSAAVAIGTIHWSVTNETVNISGNAQAIGEINLNGGDDTIIMFGNARIKGRVDLGTGNDFMDMSGQPRIKGKLNFGSGGDTLKMAATAFTDASTGHIKGGVRMDDGDDMIHMSLASVIDGSVSLGRDSDTFSLHGTSRILGRLDFGDGTEKEEAEERERAYMDGDALTDSTAAHVKKNIDMGTGENWLAVRGASVIGGTVEFGDDAKKDIAEIWESAVLRKNLQFGGSNDEFRLGAHTYTGALVRDDDATAQVMGGIDMGAGDDDLAMAFATMVEGGISMGDGDDTAYIHGTVPVSTVSDDAAADGTAPDDAVSDDAAPVVTEIVHVKGGIDMGAGMNRLFVAGASIVEGTIALGDDAHKDIVEIWESAVIRNDVRFGGSPDTFRMGEFTNPVDGSLVRDTTATARVMGGVDMGAGNDGLAMGYASMIEGGIRMGDGDDIFRIRGDALDDADAAHVKGGVDMGAGHDMIEMHHSSVISGDINLGDGNDRVEMRGNSVVRGDINGGEGVDVVKMSSTAEVTGVIDLGTDPNDQVCITDVFTSSTMLDISGVDSLVASASINFLTILNSDRFVVADFTLIGANDRMLSSTTAGIHGVVSQYLAERDDSPILSARSAWFREFNSSSSHGSSGQVAAYEHDYSGFLSGYDNSGGAIRYGIVLGFSDSELRAENRSRKTTRTAFGGGYGQMQFGEAWGLSASLLAGSERHADMQHTSNREVLGDFSSTFASLAVSLGGRYHLGNDYMLRPSAMFIGNRATANGYTETIGVQDELLTYDRRTAESTMLRAQTAMDIPLESVGGLEVFAGVQNYRSNGSDVTGALGDTRFDYSLSVDEAHGAFIGGRLSGQFQSGLRVRANLEAGQFTGDERYVSGKVEFNYSF